MSAVVVQTLWSEISQNQQSSSITKKRRSGHGIFSPTAHKVGPARGWLPKYVHLSAYMLKKSR